MAVWVRFGYQLDSLGISDPPSAVKRVASLSLCLSLSLSRSLWFSLSLSLSLLLPLSLTLSHPEVSSAREYAQEPGIRTQENLK